MSTTQTGISWTDRTWSPTVGCTKVSAGCKNCYAERMANRLVNIEATRARYEGTVKDGRWTGRVNCIESALDEPLHWRKPARIFVNSMSDLFHDAVPIEFIAAVMRTIEACPQHRFMVLTKRPERMRMAMSWWCGDEGKPVPNLWIGVSAENQQAADERIPWLLKTPAAVRFLSCEPLLGPVDLGHFVCKDWRRGLTIGRYLDWVISGGESGPRSRPAHPDWFRSLRNQCAEVGIPYHHKQNGEWALNTEPVELFDKVKRHFFTAEPGTVMHRVGKKAAGRLLDGVQHDAFPEAVR